MIRAQKMSLNISVKSILACVILWAGVSPGDAQNVTAQTCDRKLSVLEVDVAATADLLLRTQQRIAAVAKEFETHETAAQTASVCASDNARVTQALRATIQGLGTRGNLDRAYDDIACAEYFVRRITADLAAASQEAAARRVIRLTALSKRILVLDKQATESAAEAFFQASMVERLLGGLRSVEGLCVTLDQIYD